MQKMTRRSHKRVTTVDSAENRRRYLRHQALFSAKYTVKEGTFRDLITDIGAGGAFIKTRRNITLDQSINIRFPTFAFENRFYATGIVVRDASEGFAVRFNEPIDEKICQEGQLPGIISERDR